MTNKTRQQPTKSLSRRERQIMDIVYELEKCSARDVHARLDDAPSYSSVRALMGILVDKGELKFHQAGAKYLYFAATPLAEAQRGAVSRLLKTFFRGSVSDAVSALLGDDSESLSDEDLDALADMVERARKQRERE